jgi:hypothetical protein
LEDLFSKLIALIAVIVMLFFDWPRAIAGAVLGLVALNFGRPWIVLPIGILAIAGIGEVLYAATGFREAMTSEGLMLGVVTSAITAFAVTSGLDAQGGGS